MTPERLKEIEEKALLVKPTETTSYRASTLITEDIPALIEDIRRLRAYVQEVHDSLTVPEDTDEKLQTMMKSPLSLVSTVATMAYKARLLLRGEQP